MRVPKNQGANISDYGIPFAAVDLAEAYGNLKSLYEIETNRSRLSSMKKSLDEMGAMCKEDFGVGIEKLLAAVEAFNDQDGYDIFLQENSVSSIKDALDKRVLGQEDAKEKAAEFVYYHALKTKRPSLPYQSLFFTGPSGCGKTEIWRTLRDLAKDQIKIEIVQGSRITGEGWKGGYKVQNILRQFEETDYKGILVVDEFDKIVDSSLKGSETNRAASFSIQSDFLQLLEGENFADPEGRNKSIPTRDISVVFLGAFTDFESKKDEEGSKKHVGFGRESVAEEDFVEDFGASALIARGCMEELASRITTFVKLDALGEDDYRRIINSKNSSVQAMKREFESLGVKVSLPKKVVDKAIKDAIDSRTGVRGALKTLEHELMSYLYKVSYSSPYDEIAKEITVKNPERFEKVKRYSYEEDSIERIQFVDDRSM